MIQVRNNNIGYCNHFWLKFLFAFGICFLLQSGHLLKLLGFSLGLFGNEGNYSEDAGTCFWTGVKNLKICSCGLKVFGGCFRVSRCSCTVDVSSTSTETGCLSDSMDICDELDDSAYVSTDSASKSTVPEFFFDWPEICVPSEFSGFRLCVDSVPASA